MDFDLDQVRAIVGRVAGSSGLEVVDLELCGGGKARMLRIVHRQAGRRDSRGLREFQPGGGNVILDVEDAVPGGFVPVGSFVAGFGPQADRRRKILSALPAAW
jgi:hypothetical protein